MTPVVTPLQSPTPAGAPAVAFNAIPGGQGSVSFTIPGLMRAISGLDGTDLWTSDPAHPVNGVSQIAAGDLEGKGQTTFVTGRAGTIWPSTDPQHLGPPTDDGLVAFDNQGRFLWEVQGLNVRWGAPSIANLYGTAESQVVIGATVIDAHGHIVCQGADGQGDNYFGPLSTVADIDGDGIADIVTGNTVYDNHCNPKPGWPNGQADGPVAVANFTGDAHPQIVVVANGTVRLQDWQGSVLWSAVIPGDPVGDGGAPPTIADFAGDGTLAIGVSGQSQYTVFKPFAPNPILWSSPIQDSNCKTGSSVFDFQGSGAFAAVYSDECYTRVYDGKTGATLFESPNASCTAHENPVIADVDVDNRAEIVVATNSICDIQCPWGKHLGSGMHGITVFKDLRDHWVSTRSIWNEHAYHVTNINDDGSVPALEQPNWSASWFGKPLNNFRLNPVGYGDYRAPDLAISSGDVSVDWSGCPTKIRLTVTVWNRGAVLVAPGIPIAVYQGQPGGTLLATAQTAGAIDPGASGQVTIEVPLAHYSTLSVVVNDDGTGQGVVGECNRNNNDATLSIAQCPE